tara:strand:+ start:344 stop:904 length:561 start_codon:yes stop_codon:yes gene_type:complete
MFPELCILVILAAVSLLFGHCKPVVFILMVISVMILTMIDSPQQLRNTFNGVSAGISQTLKRTPNPRFAKKEETNVQAVEPPVQTKKEVQEEMQEEVQEVSREKFASKYNIPRYTPKGYAEKYDELVFNNTLHLRQSSSSRARLLNSMYADLVNESVKKDPYLRKTGETGCDLIKGSKVMAFNQDC